jgi:hypothetical protein
VPSNVARLARFGCNDDIGSHDRSSKEPEFCQQYTTQRLLSPDLFDYRVIRTCHRRFV